MVATNPISGHNAYMLVQKEDSYGVKPSGFPGTTSQYMNITSETLDDQRENVLSGRITQSYPTWTRVYRAGQYVHGSIVFDVTYRGCELIFEAAWGSRTTSSVPSIGDDVYHHIFESSLTLPSLFLEIGMGSRVMHVYGAMVDSITFAVTADGFIVATADIVAREMEEYSVPSEVELRTPTIYNNLATAGDFQAMTLTWYTRGSGTTPAYSPAVTAFEVALSNNLSIGTPINSSKIGKPFRGGYKSVSGRLVGEYGDDELEAFNWYTGGYKALWVQYVTSSEIIPERTPGGNPTDYKYELEFRGNKLDIRGGTPKVTGYGRLLLDLPFEGYFDVTHAEEDDPVPSINDDPLSFRTTNDLDANLQAA